MDFPLHRASLSAGSETVLLDPSEMVSTKMSDIDRGALLVYEIFMQLASFQPTYRPCLYGWRCGVDQKDYRDEK